MRFRVDFGIQNEAIWKAKTSAEKIKILIDFGSPPGLGWNYERRRTTDAGRACAAREETMVLGQNDRKRF